MPRKQNRIPVSINVILQCSSGRREARISDLSLGGCFIDCLMPIIEGEIVSFKLEVEDGIWLDLEGKVSYIFPMIGFGIRFLPMPEEKRGALEHRILMSGADPWRGD
ncbi:MAG TPA: PilZ domain-containing protein [Pyrinomonadaceae bacterium]|jgi:hypothetical protein